LEPDYAVVEAVNGRDGFEKAAATIPDLIICDVMMPELDGYELCHVLKNDEKTSHIPVILLTAMGGEENKLEGLQTGADDYLTKPFSSKELLARAKNLVEQRRQLREKFSREVVLKPGEIAITSADERFLNRVKEAVEKNLGDEDFSVEDLGREVGMSRVQLHRKLKALTDQSAGEFILSMRLQRAVDLLAQNAGTVAEIAYMVGFNTPNYFAKCFRKQFGCSPSEYKMNMGQQA
jgi:YesN/AraC family two-component response regulator